MVELVEQQPLALLGRLEVGDVDQDTDHAQRLALQVALDLAAVHHPAHLTVGPADAIGQLVLLLRQQDLRATVSLGIDEHEAVVRLLELSSHRVGEWLRVPWVAEGEVPLLHGHDVCEVRTELDSDADRELLRGHVRQLDVILHPVADEAVALDRDGVEREVLRQRVPQEERGGVVLDRARREQERSPAVERQLQPREEARVVHEEPVSLLTHVAQLIADAEERLDHLERAADQRRIG